jgi:histidinol-phosphate aminotransferase
MNENADGLPEEFVRKILSEIDPGFLATYPEYGSLLQKIAEHNDILPENICISNGSDGAIKYIFDAYVSPGDQVVITDPTFAMYPVYCQMYDTRAVIVPYHADFSFPLEDFLKAIKANVRLAILVNPNNPTGVALEQPALKKILNKCADNDVLLIVDEAYFYYYDETCIGEIKSYNNLVVLRTFSKLCSLASVRIGYAAGFPEIISNLYKVRPTYDVNGVAVYLVERLLDESGLINKAIEQVNRGKKFLLQILTDNVIEFRDGKANFVLIKCPGYVEEMIEALRKENILVAGGFKQSFLKDYLRVTVGSMRSMQRFCDAFLTYREKLQNRK